MVQLYGLRSERNWGIGDFTDLRAASSIARRRRRRDRRQSAARDDQGSPYSPSSRHALNVLYIDVEALPGFESSDKLRKRLRALRESELVDYEGVRRVKLEALEASFKKTKPKVEVSGELTRCSRRCARSSAAAGSGWPKEYRDPAPRGEGIRGEAAEPAWRFHA